MKRIFLTLLLLTSLQGIAQISLEHTYPNSCSQMNSDFFPSYIGPSGFKYIKYDLSTIEIYNLNHTLFSSFSFPASAHCHGDNIFLVTENLFDTDSTTIEYLVNDYITNSVSIYQNNGTMIFHEDSSSFILPFGTLSNPITPIWLPIAVTDSGVKMILNKTDSSVKVFSLPGIISNCCCGHGMFSPVESITSQLSYSLRNYPNPTNGETTIEYNLPKGITNCDLIFYNMTGSEVKRYVVTNSYHNIVINTGDLSSGMYYYQLVTTAGYVAEKKMVVIK